MVLADVFRRIAGRSAERQPTVRMASVYSRQGKFYVIASSRTRDGFWLEDGPVDVLDSTESAALEDSVRSALERSTHGIRSPKNWNSHVNRVVEAAGLKRFGAFAKGAALVGVHEESGRLRIMPHRNGGSREGYLGLESQALEIPAHSSDLARAIEAAFDRCC